MSLFKKLLGNQDGAAKGGVTKPSPPAGMLTMASQLQRKFAKGVQYNMKIVIRGDRMVGKTCLFYRLQGQKFHEEYIPTDEIQVCSIQWNYKTTDDVVKVEVWDIVDKGKKKKKSDGLKLTTEEDVDEPSLDAEFIDVYKGTHGVIMMYDVTKQWTFSYVEREVEKVPPHIPILVLGNHRDMGDHRTVMEDKARFFCRHLERPEGSPEVRYAESSMKNGFGLKYLHKFFNIPFLKLQRETLQKQLEINAEDLQSTMEELDIHEESEEQNYDVFIDALTNKKRQQQEDMINKAADQERKKSVEKPTDLQVPKSVSMPTIQKSPVTPKESVSVGGTPVGRGQPITMPTDSTPTSPQQPEQKTEQKSGFFSRFFKSKESNVQKQEIIETPEEGVEQPVVRSVEDFIPDGGKIDNSFLEDMKDVRDTGRNTQKTQSDSDEESTGNPMVTGYQDDLDSDDDFTESSKPAITHDVDLSSDEEVEPVAISTVAKDADISSDEDTNNVPVVTQDVELSSDDEISSKVVGKAEKSKTEAYVKEEPSDSSVLNSSSITGPENAKEELNQKSSLDSDRSVENPRTSSTEKERNISESSSESVVAEENVSKTPIDVSQTPSDEKPETLKEKSVNQKKTANESSDDESTTNQVTVIADVDVEEEEELQPINNAGFDSWLDELETKAGLRNDSLSSDSEAEVALVPVKKKSTSKPSKSTQAEEDTSNRERSEVKKKKKKKKDKEEGASGDKKHKKKDKQKSDKDKDSVKKEKKKKKKETVASEERDIEKEKNELEAFLNDGGDYDSL